MFYVQVQFLNVTKTSTYASRQAACGFARDCLDMFEGEEMWFDESKQAYIVTVNQDIG